MKTSVAAAAAIVVALGLWAQSQNPATMAIEYRPGAWFPPGLELQGQVRLLTSPVVEMGKRARVRIEYTVGDREIGPGEAVEVWKHFTSDVEEFQIDDSSQPAFFDAETTAAGVRFEKLKFSNNVQRNEQDVFPYRKTASIVIQQGRLSKGDKVYFDLGGEQGVRMQFYAENLFNFRVALTNPGDKKILGYGGDASLKVIGGPLAKLVVKAPSIVASGEKFSVEVVPMDAWVSLANDGADLALTMTSDQVSGSPLEYDSELLHYVANNVVCHREGVARIEVRTADGRVRGVSNPIWVERTPDRRVYYGDLHQHTYLADGRGVYEELYLYARQVAMLDFGALTPHQDPLGVTGPILKLDRKFPMDNWPALQRASKVMRGWRGFTSILGYEYSVGTRAGGHHNVLFADDDAPTTMELDPTSSREPVAKMLELLRRTKKRALVIPHIGGGPPDWNHPTDPRLERLFEIASVHGVFEESYQKHLESGQRLAATASADNHTVSWGYANPGLIYTMTSPLTAVWAQRNDREDIWAALNDRRTFGVTGATRMLLDLRANGEPMGGEIPRFGERPVRIEARVSGTEPLTRIDLVKNSKTIYTVSPARQIGGKLLRVQWGDNYYQRRANIALSNGELRADSGPLALRRKLNLDNSFEDIHEQDGRIVWRTASTSNDRDGVLVDISRVDGDALVFRLEDPNLLGTHEVRIPLAALEADGHFSWRSEPVPNNHPYMKMMGLPLQLFVDCDLVREDGAMDYEMSYEDREPLEPGDYYYLRVEQLDTVKGWSSPIWAN